MLGVWLLLRLRGVWTRLTHALSTLPRVRLTWTATPWTHRYSIHNSSFIYTETLPAWAWGRSREGHGFRWEQRWQMFTSVVNDHLLTTWLTITDVRCWWCCVSVQVFGGCEEMMDLAPGGNPMMSFVVTGTAHREAQRNWDTPCPDTPYVATPCPDTPYGATSHLDTPYLGTPRLFGSEFWGFNSII